MDNHVNIEKITEQGIGTLLSGNAEAKFPVLAIKSSLIDTFPDHPFPTYKDSAFEELKDSIASTGQLEPAIVRNMGNGRYQMLSGHRRKMAIDDLGIENINAVVLDGINDRQAEAIMLDCNVRRPELKPSEKARIYAEKKRLFQSMKQEEVIALVGRFGYQEKYTTIAALQRVVNESSGQIKRYLRLDNMSDSIKKLVDDDILPFTTAVASLYNLSREDQNTVADYISETGLVPTASQAEEIKDASLKTKLDSDVLDDILDGFGNPPGKKPKGPAKKAKKPVAPESPESPGADNENIGKVTAKDYAELGKCIAKEFPDKYTLEQIKNIVKSLVDDWKYTH